jgi:hypothetical protein
MDGGATAVGTAIVDANGDFKVITTSVLSPGTYAFDVTQNDGVESIKVA